MGFASIFCRTAITNTAAILLFIQRREESFQMSQMRRKELSATRPRILALPPPTTRTLTLMIAQEVAQMI
jgi:hypothetical protein